MPLDAFRTSFLRFALSATTLLSLIVNIRYTGWMTQSLLYVGVLGILTVLLTALGTMSALGYRVQWTTPLFAWLTILYQPVVNLVFGKPFYIHAQVFFCLGLIVLNYGPCDAFFSTAKRRLTADDHARCRQALRMFCCLVASFYFFSALAKLQSNFLSGGPLEVFLIDRAFGSLPLPIPLSAGFYRASSWAVLIFELVIPFLLLWPKSRSKAVFMVLAFHIVACFLVQVPILTVAMPLTMIAFADSEWLKSWLPNKQFN